MSELSDKLSNIIVNSINDNAFAACLVHLSGLNPANFVCTKDSDNFLSFSSLLVADNKDSIFLKSHSISTSRLGFYKVRNLDLEIINNEDYLEIVGECLTESHLIGDKVVMKKLNDISKRVSLDSDSLEVFNEVSKSYGKTRYRRSETVI